MPQPIMIDSTASKTANTVAAGPFGQWLAQARASLLGNGGAEVPCGDCTGCCTSSYVIPVRPEDTQTLSRVPAMLLSSAPGSSRNKMMLPLPDGLCPMLKAGKCSIYPHRPQTCLDYDCRIFAAAGIDAGGADRAVINQRVRAWRFTYPAQTDRLAHDAVLSAAAFIQNKGECFPGGRAPTAPTGIAVLAIKACAVFLDPDIQARSGAEIANAIINASREFDAGIQARA
jgi:hypothetical protein